MKTFGIPAPTGLAEIPLVLEKALAIGNPSPVIPPGDHSAQASCQRLKGVSSSQEKRRVSQKDLPSLTPCSEPWTLRHGLASKGESSLDGVCSGWGEGQRAFPHASEPGAFFLPGWLQELSNNSVVPVLWNLLPGNRETSTCLPGERNRFPVQSGEM